MITALLLAAAVSSGQPVELKARSLTVTPRSNVAVARGAVQIRGKAAHLFADEAEATYGAGRRIEKVVMRGNVRVVRPDGTVATGRTGTLDEKAGLITLEGDPVIEREGDTLRGERMVFRLREDRFEVSEPHLTLPARDERPQASIQARRMVVTEKGEKAEFFEEVRLRRAEARGTSEKAVMFFGPEPERELQTLVLEGNVDILEGERRARAQTATYDPPTGDVVLEGRPSVSEGRDVIRGRRIVLHGESGAARVENAVARVRSRRR